MIVACRGVLLWKSGKVSFRPSMRSGRGDSGKRNEPTMGAKLSLLLKSPSARLFRLNLCCKGAIPQLAPEFSNRPLLSAEISYICDSSNTFSSIVLL